MLPKEIFLPDPESIPDTLLAVSVVAEGLSWTVSVMVLEVLVLRVELPP